MLNTEVSNVQFQTRKINYDNPSPKLLVDRNKASVALTRDINEIGPKEQVRLYKKVYLKDFKRSKQLQLQLQVRVLTAVGKLTGDNKFFLLKQQEQVDKLYTRISKSKYRSTLRDREVVFVEELARQKVLQKVLLLQQK